MNLFFSPLSSRSLTRRAPLRPALAALLGALSLFHCTPGGIVAGGAKAPGVPGEGCDPRALNDVTSPLVIDWPSNARSDLEAAMHDGVVVVSFSCEKVKVLPDCKVAGSYGYRAVTPREETTLIEGRDNIQASFGGVSWAVGGNLERDAKLDLSYVLVGKQATPRTSLHRGELEGGDFCKGATHFVKRSDVGAFAYATGTRVSAGMSVKVLGQGAAGSSENKEVRTKRDGDPGTCKASKLADTKAPEGCGASIRVSLAPIQEGGTSKAENLSKKGLGDGLGCPAGFVFAGGACVQDASKARAFLCKEGEEKQCREQCAAGSDASCDRFARSLVYGGEDNEEKFARVMGAIKENQARLDASCKADQPNTCAALGLLAFSPMLAGGPVDKQLVGKGFDYMGRGCVAGDFTSCLFLRFAGADKEIPKEAGIDGQKLLVTSIERGCRGGGAVPCGFVGFESATGDNLGRDPRRAVELTERACQGSFAEACQIHAALLGDAARCEAILQAVNPKVSQLYTASSLCDAAVLGAIPDDARKASASLKRACDLGVQEACKNLSGPDAPAGRVALAAAAPRRAQEHERVAGQPLDGRADDGARVGEPGVGVAHLALPLLASLPQPGVRLPEALAAVVRLRDHHRPRAPLGIDDHAGVLDHVRDAGDRLGQVQRGVLAVRHAQQQHLAAEVVDAAHGAVGPVRRRQRLRPTDVGGERPRGGERRPRVGAAQDARLPPEQLGRDAHVERRRGRRIEHALAVGHRRHHERAPGAQRGAQRPDQPERPPLHRPHRPERGVHQQNPARPHPEPP